MNRESSETRAGPATISDKGVLLIVAGYAVAFALFGLVVSGPTEAVRGLFEILTTRDALITDYFGIGGIGAAFLNAGLLTLIACFFYYKAGAKMTGAAVACLLLLLGFGLFGKNLLNIWPILVGVWLYSRFRGESFATHINTAFFGVALAPIVSEILFSTTLRPVVTIPLAIVTGLVIGFILPPAAAQLFRAHMGFCLYNMGFTAGLIGVLVVALYKSYGFVPDPVFVWTTGNTSTLGPFLAVIFASMIALGFWFDRNALAGVGRIVRQSGQAQTDFIAVAGIGSTLVNMALTGIVGVTYILLVGGDLNGPVVGALLSIVGFAAFGKHPSNITPVMIGVFLASVAKPLDPADPLLLLAALFGTTLAPIAGRFGWHWGIVAGFIHASAVQTVGQLHAGLNLYNNGFAAGIVASVLVPVIIAIQSRTQPDRMPPGQSGAETAAMEQAAAKATK
ncbi:MAG: DUF1576 domain-containing protein [Candidatus Nanopelagicales bacterium]